MRSFMADIDRIRDAELRVFTNLGRLRGRPRGKHFMKEGLRRDHGALDPVSLQGLLNAADDFLLPVCSELIGRYDVAIVRCPIADADLPKFTNNVFVCDGFSCWCKE